MQPRDSPHAVRGTEELMNYFISTCKVLDSVAPLKATCQKPKQEPWLNEITRDARHLCRRAERKWKQDHLQVSHDILKDSWRKYR
uniref:Uncharacterized protein n=1 Tax=Oryzias latipes TaxID=8090 RepID=A0A3P9I5T8_ORYLA